MTFFLSIALMVLGTGLVALVLLQHKGSGLGAGFGGGGGPIVMKRRGVDLFLHKLTVGFSIVFFAAAFTNLFV